MDDDKIFEELSPYQKELSSRFFDLALSRALSKAYSSFNEDIKDEMKRVFNLDNDEEKDKFIKKNIPNFKEIFDGEMKKIEDDIKAEIERRV